MIKLAATHNELPLAGDLTLPSGRVRLRHTTSVDGNNGFTECHIAKGIFA